MNPLLERKYIVLNTHTSRVVYSSNDLDEAVDKASYYRIHSGTKHSIFSNLVSVDAKTEAVIDLYKGEVNA